MTQLKDYARWFMSIILVHRLRQEDYLKFETSLDYSIKFCFTKKQTTKWENG